MSEKKLRKYESNMGKQILELIEGKLPQTRLDFQENTLSNIILNLEKRKFKKNASFYA